MQEKLEVKKIFISYLSEEYRVAVKINEYLNKLGEETFFDRESLRPGVSWESEIKNAINTCSYFLVVWSAQGNSREESFVPVELNLAKKRAEKMINKELFIIPVLIGGNAAFPDSFEINKLQIVRLPDEPTDKDIKDFVLNILKETRHIHNYLEIKTDAVGKLGEVLKKISQEHLTILDQALLNIPTNLANIYDESKWISAACQRTDHIGDSVRCTIFENLDQISNAINYLSDWMLHETVVRVIGAGRAKIAATIPANRLAHGGARVYVQDSVVPMPHDIKGGGIIAASASGRTASVLGVLREIAQKTDPRNREYLPFKVIGIASQNATDFAELCDIFIGIKLSTLPNPLRALADVEEMIICLVLDAMVVAAGEHLGFDDTKWRLGHENLGTTGPYDASGNVQPPPHASHELK